MQSVLSWPGLLSGVWLGNLWHLLVTLRASGTPTVTITITGYRGCHASRTPATKSFESHNGLMVKWNTYQKHFLFFNDSFLNIVSSKYFKAKMKQGEIIYLLFIVQWPLVSSINHLSPYTFSQTGKYTGWRQKTFITASAHPSSYHYKFQESGPCFFGVNSSTELREIPQKC